MSKDQLIVAKARFQDLEEKDRLNPNNMLIRLLLINLVPFYSPQVLKVAKEYYTRTETEEWTDKNRLYALFIAKTSNVYDLKARLEDEISLPFDKTEIYFENIFLDQTAYLKEIPGANLSQDSILTVICNGKPFEPFNQIVRATLNEVKIQDVRFLNTSTKHRPWADWSYEDSSFDLDQTKIPWPQYRDWTQEAA